MNTFSYDKTFEGLLSSVFDAFNRRTFPEHLMKTGDAAPMFTETHAVVSDHEHAQRVWRGLKSKLDPKACNMLLHVWLSELDGSDELLFRYICKTFADGRKIAFNFGDADILEVEKIARKVAHEALYIKQFVRFQKTADGVFFAPISPIYNALPLAVAHFADRFADQEWVVYDMRRRYGYHYDLSATREISFDGGLNLPHGALDDSLLSADEKLFQDLWRGYFSALSIKERINPRLHRRNMPTRFWDFLTEKK